MAKSVYEMVTDRIIEQLENNIIPWEKPWTGIEKVNLLLSAVKNCSKFVGAFRATLLLV